MSAPKSLKDVYVDEMCDLWSANDQMAAVLTEITPKVKDAKLKSTLEKAAQGITKHTEMLKSVIEANDSKAGKEHCRGMEGLVREAKKHTTDEKSPDATLADIVVIAQYQRMSHYGLAGFGTAGAYAKALGQSDDAKTLNQIVSDIYKSDELVSRMAEQLELAAK